MSTSIEKAIGAFVTVWILTTIGCGLLVDAGLGHWIELFNGATWPEALPSKEGSFGHLFCFRLILALRTLLNLGIVLTAGWALMVLLDGGIERFVMRRMESVLHGRDTALAIYLIKVLRDKEIDLPVEIEDLLMDAAVAFPNTPAGQHYEDEARKAAAV